MRFIRFGEFSIITRVENQVYIDVPPSHTAVANIIRFERK
jgi:hypothetical protein